MPLREEFFQNFLLRATPKHELNDPFEAEPSFESRAAFHVNSGFTTMSKEEIVENLKQRYGALEAGQRDKSFLNDYGIICFTETKTNLLMWSHYADEHRGMAIEFDAEHAFFRSDRQENGLYGKLYKVNYSNVRHYDTPEWFDWFLRKSHDWRYEAEHRIINELKECNALKSNGAWYYPPIPNDGLGNDDFSKLIKEAGSMVFMKVPKPAIISVTFGAYTTREKINAVRNAINNDSELAHVTMFHIGMNEHSFELTPKQIE